MSQIVLNDVFNNWASSGGIFTVLTENFEVPWKNSVNGDIIDLEYHGNHSGQKIIAPLVERMLTPEGLSDDAARKLAGVVYYRNALSWQKLWDTLSFEYNPIENYDRHEEWTDTSNSSNTHEGSSDSSSHSSNSSSNTVRDTGTVNNENKTYGFNSIDAVDDSSNTQTNDLTTSNSSSGSESSSSEHSDSSSDSSMTSGAHEGRIHGNIGVTTSQQMIQSERDLWDWKFFDTIFEDVDSVLVIGVYGEYHESLDGLIKVDYVLPVASQTVLGGVKPLTKSDLMTMAVGVDSQGRLWSIPGSGTSEVTSVNGQKGDVVLHAGDVGAPTKSELSTVANALNGLSTVVNNISDEVEGISDDIDNINTELSNKYSPTNQPPYPVTSVNGMTGDVIVQGGGGGAVDSVNGKTGAVILNNSDVGAPSLDEFQTFEDDFDDFKSETNDSLSQKYSPTNTPPYPVTSVNGQTGAVTGLYDENNQPPYPVTSVNGMTGDVVVQGGGGSASKLYSVEITSSDTRESAYNKIAELLGDSLVYWSAIPIFGMFIDTYENVFWVVNSITIQNYGYFGVSLSCHKPDGGSQGFSFDTYDASNPFPAKKLILYFVK